MYWPTAAARVIVSDPTQVSSEIQVIRPSKRANFFASITRDTLVIWDVRPTVVQAAVIRSEESLERWGENVDVVWANDGRGLILLTSTSHLLFYQLQTTSQSAYDHPPTTSFPQGGGAGEGDVLVGWELRALGSAFVMGGCTSLHSQPHSLLVTLRHPPSILSVPYPVPGHLLSPPGSHFPPPPLDGDGEDQVECEVWDMLEAREWMDCGDRPPTPTRISVSRTAGLPNLYTLEVEDGRVYAMYPGSQVQHLRPTDTPRGTPKGRASPLPPHQAAQSSASAPTPRYIGLLLYPAPSRRKAGPSSGVEALGLLERTDSKVSGAVEEEELDPAGQVAVNPRFGLVAVGTSSGQIQVVSVPLYPQKPRHSHTFDLKHSANLRTSPGRVRCLAWTADGYCLAVGYENAWATWSMGGRLGGWGAKTDEGEEQESFMAGVTDMFWAPGNMELFLLSRSDERGRQIYSIPFAKSATASQPSPDNTRYAFLQLDDRVLVYRGADQPDMSVINPESDVWQHIKIPNAYISSNWPIRYASISSDGKLIAIAGRRGLTHYSAASGRWKLFDDERQERNFAVRGGLLWFHHVLVAAVEVDKSFQLRLYSRDLDLSDVNILHSQALPHPVQVMALLDNSLLVYTTDNMLYHFLVIPTKDTIKLHLCGSISFQGILQVPSRVRALSWMIPQAQKELGDPADDLIVATIIFLVDGKLVLLRPRRAANDEVRYDMQVLADRIEAYWTHLHGVGTLENSLWGYDGTGMRIWLDALTIESTRVDAIRDTYETVKESVYLRLDFYPLSILMDKAIIIGTDYEASLRSLPFALFKIQTGTHLFLPQFLRYHLTNRHLGSALTLASNYSSLVYFAHALEILLHDVLEDEVDNRALSNQAKILPLVIEFLDHFDQSLEVVVGCARKTEIDRWEKLFEVVGKPRELFERCLEAGSWRTAASYLLVLHNLEEGDGVKDTVRLMKLAMKAKEYRLCKELLRFLRSIDENGTALRQAMSEIEVLDSTAEADANEILTDDTASTGHPSLATIQPVAGTTTATARVLPTAESADMIGPPPTESPRRPHESHFRHPSAPSPSTSFTSPSSSTSKHPSPQSQSNLNPNPTTTPGPIPNSRHADMQTHPSLKQNHLSSTSDVISSPFQLTSPRPYMTPPSPRTVVVPEGLGVPDVPDVPEEEEGEEAEENLR